jgi:DNA-binding MarR family transcriptional regulator
MIVSPDALPTLVCACASLRRASRAVTQMYDEALRGSGVHPTQFTMLWTLLKKGDTRQGDLGVFLATDSTTLSRTLKPLQKDGLIAVKPGKDARERVLSITPKGRALVDKVRPVWEAVQSKLQSSIGAAHWDRLLNELAAVAGAAVSAD